MMALGNEVARPGELVGQGIAGQPPPARRASGRARVGQRLSTWAGIALGVAVIASAIGCSGSGVVHFIPLDVKQIPMTGALIAQINPDESYYWIDDAGKLCVALRQKHSSLWTPLLSHDISLSLVLGDPPAGVTRAYPATRDTLRMRSAAGVTQLRTGSLSGGSVVWDYGKNMLRGRFRITVKQQSYTVLTDWTGNGRMLLIGEFSATQDRERGEEILKRSEEDGLERSGSPASQVIEFSLSEGT